MNQTGTMGEDVYDIKRWSINDLFDAWHDLFPEADDHDIALVTAWLDEYFRGGSDADTKDS